MLDAFIIDQLHKKKEQSKERHQIQKEIRQQRYNSPPQQVNKPKRGIEIIDFSI